jgi:RND family efflux transporter MFP subunit
VIAALLASIWTLGVLTGCSGAGEAPSGAAASAEAAVDVEAAPEGAAERVPTSRVRRGSIASLITASGSILARQTTPLGPAVSGRLVRIHVDVGDPVKRGDPIFLIDPHPYEIMLQGAVAGLELARAQRIEAVQEAKRMEELARKQMVSQQEHDRARTNAVVARARVQQAESQVARARNDLDRTTVRAPYDGSVVERRAHEGTMASVTPNTTVVVLQETAALEVVLHVAEASLAAVRPGDPVRLHIEGVAEPIDAEVRIVSQRIDLASRTYEVRMPVSDAPPGVKAGAFARGEISPRAKESVLVVERSALTTRDGRTFAFRVSDGIAEQVSLRLGIVSDEQAEVIAGLSEGEEVVTGKVVARLTDGVPVIPEETR